MNQQSRALPSPLEDSYSIVSTHMAAHNVPNSSAGPPWAPGRCVVYRHICSQNIHTHKIIKQQK